MRGRATATVAAALLALSACGGGRSNDAAAEVGGASVSRQRLEDVLSEVAANPDVFQIQEDVETGTIAADVGRNVLSALVLDAARSQYLAGEEETVTEADRQAATETLGPQGETLPTTVRALVVEGQASATAIARLAARSGEAQAAYDASPTEVGVMCVRHILVETEAEAEEVVAELDGGAEFAELAAERSTEPAAATTGGAIELTPGEPCIPLEQAQGSLDPAFVAGALAAVPGVPTAPVQSSFGWHVILARPYEEVAVAVDPIVGQRRFQQQLAGVDVQIDPRYGRWDADAGAVVALDAPTATSTAVSTP